MTLEKFPLEPGDTELIKAAAQAATGPVRTYSGGVDRPFVATALRLDDGGIITATNLTADVNSLSVCAEPAAIALAARQPERKITALVAVYRSAEHAPSVIPPCGRCREFITDYAKDCFVILREPGSEEAFRVRAGDLLPYKYGGFWEGKRLL